MYSELTSTATDNKSGICTRRRLPLETRTVNRVPSQPSNRPPTIRMRRRSIAGVISSGKKYLGEEDWVAWMKRSISASGYSHRLSPGVAQPTILESGSTLDYGVETLALFMHKQQILHIGDFPTDTLPIDLTQVPFHGSEHLDILLLKILVSGLLGIGALQIAHHKPRSLRMVL